MDEEAKKVNETGDLKTANEESLLQKIKVKKTLKTTVLTAWKREENLQIQVSDQLLDAVANTRPKKDRSL